MNESKRLVNTPRVEIGSPQYDADAALMKLFDSYWEYLEYEADWQKDWTSYHPSIAPTIILSDSHGITISRLELLDSYYEEYVDHLGYWEYCQSIQEVRSEEYSDESNPCVSRRNNTAMRHKPGKKLLDSLQKKPSSGKRGALPYKRCRILQPQCIEAAFEKVFESAAEYSDYKYFGSFEPITIFEVSGLRISEQPAKHGKSSKVPQDKVSQKTSDLHMENLYELRLIMLAIPGISKDTAKTLQQLIYGYLEGNGKKSEGENLLDYLCSLVRPDLKKGEIPSMEKVLSLSTFRAYAEVKRLVEAVTFVDFEDSVSDVEENKPAHSKSKLIPTSDFFPMTADSSEEAADGSSAYVDRRRACISSTAHRNVSLKETQVHLTMERPNFIPLFF